jgi:carbonic anhydrase
MLTRAHYGDVLLAIALLSIALSNHGCSQQHPDDSGMTTGHLASAHSQEAADQPAPDGALRRLIVGNARFASGHTRHPHEDRGWRGQLEHSQHPFATVVGCSDSRVPLELLFDQGFGDLFVIRVAGNIVARDEAGSIEYAVVHLHTPLVAVIGHDHCGAVTAALGTHEEIMSEPPELSDLLAAIHVGMPEIPHSLPQDERIAKGVEANVRNAVRQLAKVPVVHDAVARGQTRIVGGIYSLHTGEVRWLE